MVNNFNITLIMKKEIRRAWADFAESFYIPICVQSAYEFETYRKVVIRVFGIRVFVAHYFSHNK